MQLESGDEVEMEEFYVKFKGLWVSFFFRLSFSYSLTFHRSISPFQAEFLSLSLNSVDLLSFYAGNVQSDLCIVHTWL